MRFFALGVLFTLILAVSSADIVTPALAQDTNGETTGNETTVSGASGSKNNSAPWWATVVISLGVAIISAGAALTGAFIARRTAKDQQGLTRDLQQQQQELMGRLQQQQQDHTRELQRLQLEHENRNRYQTERQRVYAAFLYKTDLMLKDVDVLRDEDMGVFVDEALKLLAEIDTLASAPVKMAADDLLDAILRDTATHWTLRDKFVEAMQQELSGTQATDSPSSDSQQPASKHDPEPQASPETQQVPDAEETGEQEQ